MLHLRVSSFLALFLLISFGFNTAECQTALYPLDISFKAYDTDINQLGDDYLAFRVRKKIRPGTSFILTTARFNASSNTWNRTHDNYISYGLAYHGLNPINNKSMISLETHSDDLGSSNQRLSIYINGEERTDDFEITVEKSDLKSGFDMIKTGIGSLALLNGFWFGSPEASNLIGITINMMGMNNTIQFPPEMDGIELMFNGEPGGGDDGTIGGNNDGTHGQVDDDCDCEEDGKINDEEEIGQEGGTLGNDINDPHGQGGGNHGGTDDDCECEGILNLEIVDCFAQVTDVPFDCEGPYTFTWSEFDEDTGESTDIRSGTVDNPLDIFITVDFTGILILEIECAGCTVTSSHMIFDCYTPPECEADYMIWNDDCYIYLSVLNCEDKEIRWFAGPGDGFPPNPLSEELFQFEDQQVIPILNYNEYYYAEVSCLNCDTWYSNYMFILVPAPLGSGPIPNDGCPFSCDETISITEEAVTVDVQDYCLPFPGGCVIQLQDINVTLPDGSTENLADDPLLFSFNYCIFECGDGPYDPVVCPPGGASYEALDDQINTWLNLNGYYGVASWQPATATICNELAGLNLVLLIEGTNVQFNIGYEIIDNSPLLQSFVPHNPSQVATGDIILTLVGLCEGAQIVWSTGETTASIIVSSTNGVYATVTCPNGCVYTVFPDSGPPRLEQGEPQILTQILSDESDKPNILPDVPKELGIPQLEVYPNPSTQVFNIRLNDFSKGDYELLLFDTQGQKIAQEKILVTENLNVKQINLNQFPPGVYFLSVFNSDFRFPTERLILIK